MLLNIIDNSMFNNIFYVIVDNSKVKY